MPMKIKKKE